VVDHFLKPLVDAPRDAFHLTIARDGSALATTVEPAFDSESRRRGLLGRDALDDRAALIIAPCQAVHTFSMRFPIDIVFVARDGLVVKLREDVRPGHMTGAWSAFAVIELAAGAIARAGLLRGDRLTLVRAGISVREIDKSTKS
jgi:uncharacterized membrane protein (UPF0127 family)